MREHDWKKLRNVIVCKVCGMIKGSNPNKNSKCDGVPPSVRFAKKGESDAR